MSTHYCHTCHWQRDMHCHVNPPQAQLMMVAGLGGQQPQPISFHPPVRPTEFCSKHSALSADVTVIDVH